MPAPRLRRPAVRLPARVPSISSLLLAAAVAIGSGRALENIEAMRGMMSSPGIDLQ